jgi:hypothetical protein
MDIRIHYVRFMRVMLYGPVAPYPLPIPCEIEANEVAQEAYNSVCEELGLMERCDLSKDDMTRLRSLVRERAVGLCGQIGTQRPPVSQVFRGVDRFVFMNEIVDSNIIDGRWFRKNPDRKYRARKPLPHELAERLDKLGKDEKMITIVIRGGVDDKGNIDPPLAVPCVVSKVLNGLDDRELESIVAFSLAGSRAHDGAAEVSNGSTPNVASSL